MAVTSFVQGFSVTNAATYQLGTGLTLVAGRLYIIAVSSDAGAGDVISAWTITGSTVTWSAAQQPQNYGDDNGIAYFYAIPSSTETGVTLTANSNQGSQSCAGWKGVEIDNPDASWFVQDNSGSNTNSQTFAVNLSAAPGSSAISLLFFANQDATGSITMPGTAVGTVQQGTGTGSDSGAIHCSYIDPAAQNSGNATGVGTTLDWGGIHIEVKLSTGVTLTPSPVVAKFVIPAPTVVPGTRTLTPSPVVAKFVIATPVMTGLLTITPSPVVATFAVPAPTVTLGTTLTPSPVVAKFQIAAPTLAMGVVTLTPSPVVARFVTPTPTITSLFVLTPSPVVATYTVPTPTIVKGTFTLTPSPVVATFIIATPTLVKGAISVTPSPVVATFTVPTPTIARGVVTLVPTPVVARFIIATPSVFVSGQLAPQPVVARFQIATPTITRGAISVTPSPVVATYTVPAPTIVRGVVTLVPTPVVARFSVPTPFIFTGQTIAASPVVARFIIATPTLVTGPRTLTASPVVARFIIPAPSVFTPILILVAQLKLDLALTLTPQGSAHKSFLQTTLKIEQKHDLALRVARRVQV